MMLKYHRILIKIFKKLGIYKNFPIISINVMAQFRGRNLIKCLYVSSSKKTDGLPNKVMHKFMLKKQNQTNQYRLTLRIITRQNAKQNISKLMTVTLSLTYTRIHVYTHLPTEKWTADQLKSYARTMIHPGIRNIDVTKKLLEISTFSPFWVD